MTFFKDFSKGIKAYSKASKFLIHHKLTWFFIFPILLNILLFILGYASTVSLSSKAIAELNSWISIETWEFWGSGVLYDVIFFLINILIRLLFISIFAFIGGYFVLILLSPIYAILSEKVEQKLTGNEYPFSIKQFAKDVWRGILLALRNLGLEIIITIGLFALSFVPVVGLVSGPLLFLVTAYFYGFSFMDYTMERQNLNLNQSINFAKTNKGLTVGNGTIFSAILLIPYIGVLISGFVSIIAITAATISTIELMIDNKQKLQ
ncbi:EI24 domain-containing protein [Saccharicrinis aurantiacus]|uniref:EI24 domain-containing protein n=1 Tax=Saccharicrinis aurantiacus TaxID=1849719 RepID=UPI00094F61D1|nr:EI24 domain-containing protein [Saccharicrinis aurantiacus]